jgi:hypothetical protein
LQFTHRRGFAWDQREPLRDHHAEDPLDTQARYQPKISDIAFNGKTNSLFVKQQTH